MCKKYNTDAERKEAKKMANQKWCTENPEKLKKVRNAASKKWNGENKEKVNNINKLFKESNPDYQKKYRKTNLKVLKIKRNRKEKERKNNDLIYKLKCDISRSFRQSLKKNGYTKKSRTHEILGCSFIEFKLCLESKFESWMNWENKALYNGEFNYGWDIDHIEPLASAKTEEDIIRLNHYTNLQPLCSKINRDIKRDRKYS